MISVLVLTLNEEKNIRECLNTVKWCDDVIVLDSQSSDNTTKIAASCGATVIKREFDNWAAHQNWAMENIRFKHGWVFYLDADERMTDDVAEEIKNIATDETEARVAFFCGRKNFFMGKWIRHAMPPGMIMRFFRPEHVRFERLVNPTPIITGPYGYLSSHFLHYNFSKGLSEWFEKHNKYSQMEAIEGLRLLREQRPSLRSLFSRDRFIRRKSLKRLSFRMPFRPLLKFVYLYFFKLGFLDGYPGLVYCRLQSTYEYMIVVKMAEQNLLNKGISL